MRVSEESLRGRSIIASDGQVVGEISSVVFDSDDWRVTSLEVTLRKEIADQLGAHRSIFQAGVLEIPTRLIQSLGETVVLLVPLDELRKVLPSESEQAPSH